MKMFIFCHIFKIKNRQQIWTPQIVDGDPFCTEEPQKSIIFCVWRRHFPREMRQQHHLSQQHLGSCSLKTIVAKNWWFYQYVKKIGTTNENWIVGRWGGTNLLSIYCHRGPPPICCQFVILAKSYSWQHM